MLDAGSPGRSAIEASRERRPTSLQRTALVLQIGFWVLFGALVFVMVRPVHPFPVILIGQVTAAALTGLALSTALAVVYDRFLSKARHRHHAVPILVLSSPILGLAWYEVTVRIAAWIDPFAQTPVVLPLPGGELFAAQQVWLFAAVMTSWTVAFVAIATRRQQQAQRERLLRAEALAHEARLKMLRYQLNPHFLFNALNSIGALAMEAPERVQRMVTELSGFLRYSLLESPDLVVPLRDEIAAARHYLAVEKVRFEDELAVDIDVDDAAASREVPAFVVLPLVENAVKHGRQTSRLPLRIRIVGRVDGDAFCIEVANTGSWVQAPEAAGTRTGLKNVRQRLAEHYGERNCRMDVVDEGDWVSVRIRIDDRQR